MEWLPAGRLHPICASACAAAATRSADPEAEASVSSDGQGVDLQDCNPDTGELVELRPGNHNAGLLALLVALGFGPCLRHCQVTETPSSSQVRTQEPSLQAAETSTCLLYLQRNNLLLTWV